MGKWNLSHEMSEEQRNTTEITSDTRRQEECKTNNFTNERMAFRE
jgi:hypothetical protein